MTTLNEIRKNAVETLQTGKVVDQYTWNVFCSVLKTFPSSDDFSADDLFNALTLCCDECQRGDHHHHEEHGSCCGECAKERETTDDIVPFIMKNYYHANKRYYNDATDIWFAHDRNAVVYEYEMINDCLPPENWYDLCKTTCACCSCPISSCGSKFSYIV
jgi:hypothetical protein